MKKVLVTGANGQLGKCLKDVVSQFPLADYEFIFTSRSELDISKKQVIESFFFSNQIDICVNCAAYTAVDLAEEQVEEAFLANADGPFHLAKECQNQGAKFIHVSTDYVFDGTKNLPYHENDVTAPLNVYGKSKLAGEQKVLSVYPASVVIRTSWVYSIYGKNFVKTMCRLMSERDSLNVVSDQIGNPTNAYDLAVAIHQVLQQDLQGKGGVYHYSNTGNISWFDFASKIAQIKGFSTKVSPIASSEYPTPAKRSPYSTLDCTKFFETFGISIIDWEKSLSSCLSLLTDFDN